MMLPTGTCALLESMPAKSVSCEWEMLTTACVCNVHAKMC